MAQYLASILASCTADLANVCLRHEEGEKNLNVDAAAAEMTPLLRALAAHNADALNVEATTSKIVCFLVVVY